MNLTILNKLKTKKLINISIKDTENTILTSKIEKEWKEFLARSNDKKCLFAKTNVYAYVDENFDLSFEVKYDVNDVVKNKKFTRILPKLEDKINIKNDEFDSIFKYEFEPKLQFKDNNQQELKMQINDGKIKIIRQLK